MRIQITSPLIAPCGMNCALCIAYQRKDNKCSGCSYETFKVHCMNCSIKNCDMFRHNNSKYCFECSKFPCHQVKALDKRYRTKYGMSMIDNLNRIKEIGIRKFVQEEKDKWCCPECGNIISVHRNSCLSCGAERNYLQST